MVIDLMANVSKLSFDLCKVSFDFSSVRGIGLRPIQTMLFTCVVLCFIACSDKDKAMEHYQKAYELENADKYAEAILQLDSAILLDKTFELAYLDRGIDKGILEDFGGAIVDFNKLIDLRPNSVEPYVWRAENKRFLKRYESALKDIEIALSNKTNFIVTEEGGIYLEINQDYNNPNADNPNYDLELEYILYEKGLSLVHLGQYEESLSPLYYCIEKGLNVSTVKYYRGIAYWNLGRKVEACEDLYSSAFFGHTFAADLYDEYCYTKTE